MRQGIKSTTERAGADIIVVPDEGTEDIRDSLFAGKPCSVFFDRSMKEAVEQVEGVERVSGQMYVGTLSASCCSLPVQMIAFDPETDFVVQPWLKNPECGPPGKGAGSGRQFSGGGTGRDAAVLFYRLSGGRKAGTDGNGI